MAEDARISAARARRDQILQSVRWADASGFLEPDAHVFRVWDGRAWLTPAFQFDGDGNLLPCIAELLSILPNEDSGWRQMLWLTQPHALLQGRTPIEDLQFNSAAVIVAARSSFDPGDTNW